MTLLALHLATILPPDNPESTETMPTEMLPELRVADLLERAGDIIEAHERNPEAERSVNGYLFAQRANDYFREAYDQLATTGSEDSAMGQRILQHIDQTDQLAADHLDRLDNLGGSTATISPEPSES